jgi:hypothetical protein
MTMRSFNEKLKFLRSFVGVTSGGGGGAKSAPKFFYLRTVLATELKRGKYENGNIF